MESLDRKTAFPATDQSVSEDHSRYKQTSKHFTDLIKVQGGFVVPLSNLFCLKEIIQAKRNVQKKESSEAPM